MAAGQNIPDLGGYDLKFKSKVPDDFHCPVCQLPMKDPRQIERCGHRLCTICLEGLFRQPSARCPVDREPLLREKIFSDNACQRRILDLHVECSFDGCSWTGELRAMERHQSECLFKVVECSNAGCKERLTRTDINNHKEFDCPWREINCDYCRVIVIMKNKQQHFGVCPKFPIPCTNNCDLRHIPREKLEVHIRDDCPSTKVPCEYKNLGCGEVFPRKSTKSHLELHAEHHLDLALRGLEATRYQVEDLLGVVKDQSQQIEGLKSKDKNQSQLIERLNLTVQCQAQQIEQLTTNAKDQVERIVEAKAMINFLSQQIEELMLDKGKGENQPQNAEVGRELQPKKQSFESPSRFPVYQRKEETDNCTQNPQTDVWTPKHLLNPQFGSGLSSCATHHPRLLVRPFAPDNIRDIKLGMELLVTRSRGQSGRGTVRYIGKILGRKDDYIGVELGPGQEGKHDGTLDGQRYFSCTPNRGIFVSFNEVVMCYSA
ncbi:TNF receptor-associated factor 6-like isoform X4 [Stylophora pistillata]|uniref:TNF receptor-associated factor 6-like isoform X4 n=1 Tax=Stylophora pistillata TaxID=50429 RepID=UPI000C054ED2|nr:TNF receptor-associated factor 6-like isoform X4 [Stylophora pistillata]